MTFPRGWAAVSIVLATACTHGDGLDPADLDARDLLGLEPRLAMQWSDAERADAHRTFDAAFRAVDPDGELTAEVALDDGLAPEVAVARGLDAADVELAAAEQPPRLAVIATADGRAATVTELALDGIVATAGTVTPIVLVGWEVGAPDGWDVLPRRTPGFLIALAEAAGRGPTTEPLEVVPAPRVGFAAAWLDAGDRLLVNPVLLAALDEEPGASGYPISVGAPLVWRSPEPGGGVTTATIAARDPVDGGAELAFPAGEDAGIDANPPPPSGGGESCEGPTCDGPACGDGCNGDGCNSSGCSGDGGGCGNSGGGGQCGVTSPRGHGTVAWFVIPLLLLRRWRTRERKQARRACDPG